MKRLFGILFSVIVAVAFLPTAEAGDSAILGLTVAFDQSSHIPQAGTVTAYVDGQIVTEAPAGREVLFKATYIDEDGYADMEHISLVLAEMEDYGISLDRAIRVIYIASQNKLYAVERGLGGVTHGGYEPGSLNKIDVYYGTLDCSKTVVSGDGNVLTITWALTLKDNFKGHKDIYEKIMDGLHETDYLKVGDWAVTGAPLQIWSEPEGPFEIEFGGSLEFKVIAADQDSEWVEFTIMNLNGGEWTPLPSTPGMAAGIFRWTSGPKIPPDFDGDGRVSYMVDFVAVNAEGEKVRLEVIFTVILPPPLKIHTSASGQIYVLWPGDPISFEVYAEGDPDREIKLEMVHGDIEGTYFELDPFPVPPGTKVGRFHWAATTAQIREETYLEAFRAYYADDPASAVEVAVEFKVIENPNHDVQIWTDPQPGGPFEVTEGKELRFLVMAEDLDATTLELRAGRLPEGAEFSIIELIDNTNGIGVKMIGEFVWTPQPGQAQTDYHYAEFEATSDNQNGWIGLGVPILVYPAPEPIKIWTEPEGPFRAIEGDLLTFNVRGSDEAGNPACLTAIELPPGASFNTTDWFSNGVFIWTPDYGQAQNEPYIAVIKGWIDYNHNGSIDPDEPTGLLTVEIFVVQPIIAIELLPASWDLSDVKLGDDRYNTDDGTRYGNPQHTLKNTGNVGIDVVMAYADWYGVPPAYDTLEGHFQMSVALVTGHLITIQPPDSPIPPAVIRKGFAAGTDSPLTMHYHAPVSLPEPVDAMGATFDVKAYKAIE